MSHFWLFYETVAFIRKLNGPVTSSLFFRNISKPHARQIDRPVIILVRYLSNRTLNETFSSNCCAYQFGVKIGGSLVSGSFVGFLTMLSDDGPRRRALVKALSEDDLPRIPPSSENLFENLPWASIMADIAIAAAVAEIKVNFF